MFWLFPTIPESCPSRASAHSRYASSQGTTKPVARTSEQKSLPRPLGRRARDDALLRAAFQRLGCERLHNLPLRVEELDRTVALGRDREPQAWA